MRNCLFLLVFVYSSNCFSQNTYVYDGNGNIIGGTHIQTVPGKMNILKDTLTGTTYTLDSAHIYVTAISANGDTLWRTDPWKDNNLMEYRVKRPIIVQFRFRTLQIDNSEIIYIVYNNTQFGTIKKTTGAFDWMGQD